MEDECPCIDCLCVPACKNKKWYELVQECKLIHNFFKEVENQIPRTAYRYLNNNELNRIWEISKSSNGNCTWKRRDDNLSSDPANFLSVVPE